MKRLIEKKATTKLKGFKIDDQKVDGIIKLDEKFEMVFENKSNKTKPAENKPDIKTEMPICPKCKNGSLIKGKTAYGCGDWKNGCDFKFAFEDIKAKARDKKLTRELVMEIISMTPEEV